MIAYGCSIDSDPVYRRCAAPGLRRVAEADSRLFLFSTAQSIAATYNLILDRAAAIEDLEALVLVHEDAEINDPAFVTKVRRALADERVALAGPVGVSGATSIAWWDGLSWIAARVRYPELGGGELPWPAPDDGAGARGTGEVDALYGVLLVLSPWAVRNLRFDEAFGAYGHDFDICAQARAQGRTVLAADFDVVHHHSLEILADEGAFADAHMRMAEKWDGAERTEEEWRTRARLAEADAGAARLLSASTLLEVDATEAYYENRLDEVRATRSWRWTEPLRRGNALARLARARLTAPRRSAAPRD